MREKYISDLEHIHSMMEKSSTFVSLSGLSGVFAGIVGCIAAFLAYFSIPISGEGLKRIPTNYTVGDVHENLLLIGIGALILALSGGILFTYKKSKSQGLSLWTSLTKRIIVSLAIPLVSGGVFCLVLLYHGMILFVAPTTLIFYGLALVNAGKYVYNEIVYLGMIEIVLGIIALLFLGYGLLFWGIGFGVLHIIYGLLMFKKYH